ncbi:MAG: hypothetical protein ACR5K4_03170 [Sodalis sp. (in: enterobacteria)]
MTLSESREMFMPEGKFMAAAAPGDTLQATPAGRLTADKFPPQQHGADNPLFNTLLCRAAGNRFHQP